jgi:transcriptional regulator GlxA family with amidase domain
MIFDIVVFDGLDELDALGPLEVLRRAEQLGGDVTARLVTRCRQDRVRGGSGLVFEPDGVFVPGEADVVIVPGGGWASRAPEGAWAEVQRGDLLPLLATARASSGIVAGVCTGTMILAHAGVIGARRASTHRVAHDDLSALGAQVLAHRVVDDGDLVTSGGVTSGIDLALWLVEREVDPGLADRVAEHLEYPRFRPLVAT